MTREEAIRITQGLISDFKCDSEIMVDYCNTVIKALEQQPCDDAISRQAAINAVSKALERTFLEHEDIANKIINKLPPVTPAEKVGQWIDEGFYADGHSAHAYRCSKCGEHYIGYEGEYKYCPNCGSYNGGDAE